MAKYDDLHNHLKAHRGHQQVALTFRDIERILGTRLPDSAREHRPWWGNTHGHVSAHAWLAGGFRAIEVNLQAENVVFGRDAPAPGTALTPARAAAPSPGVRAPPVLPAPPTTRQGLGDDLDWVKTCLRPTCCFVRSLRNSAGHPTGKAVPRDDIAAHIMMRPAFLRRVASLQQTVSLLT